MTDKQRTISQNTALAARGLWTLGHEYNRKAREAEAALSELLGYEDPTYCDCLSDEMYNENNGSFDAGMKKEGFTIDDGQ